MVCSHFRKVETDEKSPGEFRMESLDTSKGVKSVEFRCDSGADDTRQWVLSLNTRIALVSYLHELNNSHLRGCREIVDFIADTDLSLSTLRIEDSGGSAVRTALTRLKDVLIARPSFHNFIVNCSEMGDEDVRLIADIASRNPEVVSLELRDNHLGPKGAAHLAGVFMTDTHLRRLNLDGNHIGDEGAEQLARAVARHPRLSVLSLAENEISDAGVVALVDALMHRTRQAAATAIPSASGVAPAPSVAAVAVSAVVASATDRRTAMGVQTQMHAPAVPPADSDAASSFPLLNLAGNRVGSRGASRLADLCRVNKLVKEINLERNLVDDAGVIALAEALMSGRSGLSCLNLSCNQLSSRAIVALSEALKATNGAGRVEIDLCGNRMLGRSGLATILDADFPLEFPLLKIVRPQ